MIDNQGFESKSNVVCFLKRSHKYFNLRYEMKIMRIRLVLIRAIIAAGNADGAMIKKSEPDS